MNCCIECFTSEYIKDIITKNSNNRGNCNFCNTENVNLYEPRELFFYFKNLLDLYVPKQMIGISTSSIENQIIEDFPNQIFNEQKLNPPIIKNLINSIIQDEKEDFRKILENPVCLECNHDPISKQKAEILKISWDEFALEIKSEYRYHINRVIDLDKLEQLIKRVEKSYRKGKIFYRARISDKNGYRKDEMNNPPNNKARAGRANPEGISYLYLSNDLETTIFETRAYLFDFVTIGEFRLNEDITVIDLRGTKHFDPILLADQDVLEDFLIHLPFISHLETELSKPLRRNDNKLDYIPTQYLSEFIKSKGYSGIEYKSSLNPSEFNLAIFNSDKLECIKCYVKEIHEISYTHKYV